MAHFAKIGLNNKVMSVHSVHNNELLDADGVEQENIGIEFLTNLHGWAIWKQTSYNTIGGVHKLGGTPLRKNHAAIGYTYDEVYEYYLSIDNCEVCNKDISMGGHKKHMDHCHLTGIFRWVLCAGCNNHDSWMRYFD